MIRSYLVGLIGAGVRSSGSPALHENEAAALGLRYVYRTIDIDRLDVPPEGVGSLVSQAQLLGYDALNVTHPCKQIVVGALDELSPEAALLGAVNTVILRDGRSSGHNTDYSGFAAALRDGLPGADLDRVVLLGCGGAGAAIAYALLLAGAATLRVSDPDPERAHGLARAMAPSFPAATIRVLEAADVEAAVASATGLVNATPIGMVGHEGAPLPVAELHPALWVADAVYRPVRTQLIRAAEALGCRTLDGGRMVVGQAADTFRLITGVAPDRERMRRDFLASPHPSGDRAAASL